MSGHICQSAATASLEDPDFPDEFVNNPWCWYAVGGFHRARSSATAKRNVRIEKGKQRVTANSMTAALAISLGADLGTSSGHPAEGLGAGIARMHEVSEYDFYQGSADVWARFGYAASYTGRALNEIGYLQEYLRILVREMTLQRKMFAGRAELERLVGGEGVRRRHRGAPGYPGRRASCTCTRGRPGLSRCCPKRLSDLHRRQ